MTGKNSQTCSHSIQQNNDPDRGRSKLNDSDIQELISFFRLLDEWDREYKLKVAQEEKAP